MSYMRGMDWVQLLVFCIGLLLITKPMGIYLLRVFDRRPGRRSGHSRRKFWPGGAARLQSRPHRSQKAAELETVTPCRC